MRGTRKQGREQRRRQPTTLPPGAGPREEEEEAEGAGAVAGRRGGGYLSGVAPLVEVHLGLVDHHRNVLRPEGRRVSTVGRGVGEA